MTNSKERGRIRVLIYRDKKVHYASALELNITESGKDVKTAMKRLNQAVEGYLDMARKHKMNDEVLDQEVDKNLEKMWNGFTQKLGSNKNENFTALLQNKAQTEQVSILSANVVSSRMFAGK